MECLIGNANVVSKIYFLRTVSISNGEEMSFSLEMPNFVVENTSFVVISKFHGVHVLLNSQEFLIGLVIQFQEEGRIPPSEELVSRVCSALREVRVLREV